VHEVPGQGAWLKVPLGKLDSERMVPLDDDILELIDHIAEIRSPGRALPHPRYGRPAQFLFTHHGRRLSQNAVREELQRAAGAAGLGRTTPHQLRHTYATALVNAGVSLQALMALLGHVSAAMSLRYGRLFDATVKEEYERALTLAKQRLGATPGARTSLPLTDITGGADWKDTPLIKSRLSGGFCLRAPAQGACTYANICEHCPSFHSDASFLPVLAAQRADAEALARDAEERGWISEATRHRKLLTRLDTPDQPGPDPMTSTDTITRVERTCAELQAAGHAVTFTEVAARTGLGRTTLYRNPALRALVEHHRIHAAPASSLSRLAADIATLTTALEAIAARVRQHEEQLRRLDQRRTA
jgi:hypothetical protein